MLASIILAAAFAALGTNGVDGACGPKGRRITLALLGDSITNCGYQDRLMKRMHGAGYAGYTPVGTHTGFSASDEKLPGLAAHDGFGGFCYDTFLTRYQFAEDELMNVQAKAEYEQMKALGVQKVERKDWRRVLLKSPLVRYENGRKTVDVKGWLDRVNGGEPPDYVVIQLGQNGVFAQTDGSLTNHVRDVQLAGAEALLAALRKEAPDAVYAFTTALPGSEDDTHWKANYGEKHTKAQGRRNFAYFNAELRKWIAAKKDPRVRLVDWSGAIDVRIGYVNALHANEKGAVQLGDALFAWLDAELGTRPEFEVCHAAAPGSVVAFAADELTNFLSQATGSAVPVVKAPGRAWRTIILGTNAWSAATGVDPARLPRDSYVIRAEGRRIYIAGCDEPKEDFRALLACATRHWPLLHGERATLFGVYGFLERYAGVRFYFPGELGTVVPRCAAIVIPEGTTVVSPDFTVRETFSDSLSYVRNGAQTKYIPCAHGLAGLSLRERFYKSHPEYFALRKGPDGRLVREPEMSVPEAHAGQLCWGSDALWEQIHDDAVAYFSGVSAEEHGVPDHYSKKGWRWCNAWYGEYFDVMGQDGFQPCLCEKCQAEYLKGEPQYATEIVWRRTAELANRLLREGVKGTLTQMAYPPYRGIPSCEIPTNVLVMVSERGPWSAGDARKAREDDDEVIAWSRKLGRKVWLWTYPGKYGSLALDDVPQMTPRAIGRYFRRLSPWIFGAKLENETDRRIYNYLNEYVWSKVAWDNTADPDALVDEHHRLMFGAAADEMRRFYGFLERQWIRRVCAKTADTAVGPVTLVPSALELWTDIYSPALMDRCEGLFRRAEEKVAPGSLEARRLRFVKEQFLDPLAKRARAGAAGFDVAAEERRRAASRGRNVLGDGETGWHSWPAGLLQSDNTFTATNRTYVSRSLKGLLEPGRCYRISLFLQGEDIAPFSSWDGGLNVEISDGTRTWRHPYPNGMDGTGFTGTFGRIHTAFEFKVSEKPTDRAYLAIRLANCTGKAHFDGVRVEPADGFRKSNASEK